MVNKHTFVGFRGAIVPISLTGSAPGLIHLPPHGQHGLTVLDDETIEWLLNTCLEV